MSTRVRTTTCPVCQDDIDDHIDGSLPWPGCGHRIHISCALSLAQYDVKCPICRRVPDNVTERVRSTEDHLHDFLAHISSEDVSDLRISVERNDVWLRRRVHRNYMARRRRVLQTHGLVQLDKQIKQEQRELKSIGDVLNRCWNEKLKRAMKDVWKEDAEMKHIKRKYDNARKRLRRKQNRLDGQVIPIIGIHPLENYIYEGGGVTEVIEE